MSDPNDRIAELIDDIEDEIKGKEEKLEIKRREGEKRILYQEAEIEILEQEVYFGIKSDIKNLKDEIVDLQGIWKSLQGVSKHLADEGFHKHVVDEFSSLG